MALTPGKFSQFITKRGVKFIEISLSRKRDGNTIYSYTEANNFVIGQVLFEFP
jgi:hypothetical protein